MNYMLNAFGYELIVGQTGRGTWTGGYREVGSKGGYDAIEGEFPDANSAKIATCKAIQALTANIDKSAIDPCTETASAWTVE